MDDKDTSGDFAALMPADRRAIEEILRDTKPEYAAWRTSHPDSPVGVSAP